MAWKDNDDSISNSWEDESENTNGIINSNAIMKHVWKHQINLAKFY